MLLYMINNSYRSYFGVLGFIVIFIALAFSVSCMSTCSELSVEAEKTEKIVDLVSIGDDVHEARTCLLNAGFQVSDVGYVTILHDELSFHVTLTHYDSLDGLESSIETRFRPWRKMLMYNYNIRADSNGKITAMGE